MPTTPFADVRASLTVAATAGIAGLAWVVVAGGGRWLGVHFFTLGVLTPLVVGFSAHFAATLTRAEQSPTVRPAPTAAGIAAVVVGLPTGSSWLLATGGVVLTVVVFDNYRQIRRLRRCAVGARFGWIVRVYERAHGAFVHGAALGVLMGIGVLPAAWYLSARQAHLHINVLGWGGLTLLATLVFFGPTLVRARIPEGAEDRAAMAIRHGATGLTVATIAILLTGLGGTAGLVLRVLASVGLAVLARAVAVVCLPVARVAGTARRGAQWGLVIGSGAWFVIAAWADVAVVATGQWQWLTPLGVAALVGVLGQAVMAAVSHVGPLLLSRARRLAVLNALEKGALWRALAWNTATALLVASAIPVGLPAAGLVSLLAWILLAGAVVHAAAMAGWAARSAGS